MADAIDKVGRMKCVCCGRYGVDAHHVTTRGAGGKDTLDNLMPLCRNHHTEYHLKGHGKMIERYPGVKNWLELAGRVDIFLKAKRLLP